MDKPAWREKLFEGRRLVMAAVGDEVEMKTAIGTRWAVPVRVEVLSGLFAGAVYEEAWVFAPTLKEQLAAEGRLEGVLRRGARLQSGRTGWVVKQNLAGQG